MIRKLLLAVLLLLGPALAMAHPADTYQFRSPEAERRAMTLARELRCPQCQNQNLMESNSPIAQDLRLEVYRLVDGGASDTAVVAHMTERFGDFVRYRPPLNSATWLLWGAPALLLLVAAWMVVRLRRDPASAAGAVSTQHPAGSAQMAVVAAPRSATPPLLASLIVVCAIAAVLAGYAASGRWQEAEHWRNNPDPLLGLTGDNLKDAAQQRLEARIRANPRDIEAWAELGQLYAYNDEFTLALKVYDRIAELEGAMNASTAAAKATVLYYQAGQKLTPAARQLLDQALAKDPGEVTALMLLASDYFLLAQYQQAIDIWQKLLDEGRPRINREQLIRAIQTARQLAG